MIVKMIPPEEQAKHKKRLREEQNRRVLNETGVRRPTTAPASRPAVPPNAEPCDVIPLRRRPPEEERKRD